MRLGAGILGSALVVAALGGAPAARAEPLRTNDFAIDLFQGPVLAPIRVTGIAGAYAGYAEGIAGFVANAAAPALREPYSVAAFDGDVDASLSLPLLVTQNDDFDNSGKADDDYSNFIYLQGGALVQKDDFGFGAIAEFQRYTIDASDIVVGRFHLLGAYRLLEGQLVVGGGARLATLGIAAPGATLTMAGAGPEVGVIVRPDDLPFRLGATYRTPVSGGGLLGSGTVGSDGVERAGRLVVPERVVLPWEIEVGGAVQFGSRPLNPRWPDPDAEEASFVATERAALEGRIAARRRALERPGITSALRNRLAAEDREDARAFAETLRTARDRLKAARRARYWNWPREHVLFTAELLVSGPVRRGLALEAFLGQNEAEAPGRAPLAIGSSGGEVNFSPRFGFETEPLPMRIATRFGTYYEPSRFARVGRQHFTFGADLRLFSTTLFGLIPTTHYKLQGGVDVAPRYESFSLGLGVWH